MLARCCNNLVRRYSIFLYKYPYIFLILTPIFLVICVVFSFVPAVGPDFPDFSKPTEGFEPRGTEIMKRIVTQQETLKAAIRNNDVTCDSTGVNNSPIRKRRSSQSSQICNTGKYSPYRYASVVTVYEGGGDLFNANDLKSICVLEEQVVRDTPSSNLYCSCPSSTHECGLSLSLGSYIAFIQNRSSCHDLTDSDVAWAKNLLTTCAPAHFSKKQSTIAECVQHRNKEFVKDVFDLLVDVDFLQNNRSTVLKNAMALSPRFYDEDFARDIYDQHLSDGSPERNGVKLVAFEFGNFKFDQFNFQLLLDAVFPAIGLVMVALILFIYTHSLLVMALTVFSVITSVLIAYFIYHQIFRLTFFPFLNILTFIFLVGIGADDAFVFTDVWSQAKRAKPDGSVVDWIEYTLSHAALSMFVTSFTTSAAFYANVVSRITAIRLFGIFAGTSILIMYSLMITWFPAGVIFMEKRRQSRRAVVNPFELQANPSVSPHPTPQPNGENSQSNSEAEIAKDVENTQQPSRPLPCRYYDIVRSKCSKFMRNLFENWIPTSLRGYPIWLIVFLALGVGMICAVTVSPGLQRPKSADFQVFSSSHILEQYELKYKNKFRLSQTNDDNFNVLLYFGIKAEDNGNHLDPNDFGELVFDDSFDILLPKSQEWFLRSLCSEIRKQKFFDPNIQWTCFPELLNQCVTNMNWSLPLNETQVGYCLQTSYYHRCTDTDRTGLFFQAGKVKGIGLKFPTNIHYTNDYETVDGLWSEIQDFESSVLDEAPKGMQDGWAISWMRFYALQKNLGTSTISSLGVSLAIAFVVMLLTSLNWVVSVYAIVTIICTLATTIGSLVLDGWELNILESIVMSVAVGLSVDFTLHYGVAYNVSSEKGRVDQVKSALGHIGPAVTLAAITTFIAGVFMMFSTVLAYFQLGQFLTLVMAISWLFATFFFMSLCYFAGPVGHFGQINSKKCTSCKVPNGG